MKKILPIILTASLALQTAVMADFADTTEHWASEYIEYCAEIGIINGVSDTEFMPDETLTVAQSVVAIAKLHSYFEGTEINTAGDTWYSGYVAYLEDLGAPIPSDMTKNCTRMEFFKMLEAVVREGKLTKINSVSSIPDTTDEGIIAFYEAGIISGMNEYGTFYGDLTITRAECSALLARLADYTIRLEFTLTKGDDSEAMQKLYLPADATAITIGGTEISAEVYTAFLSYEVDVATATKQMVEHPEYEYYFSLWNTGNYLGNFEQYLSEIHGESGFDATDFAESDAELKATVEADLRYYVALMQLCEQYNCGLSEEQEEALENYASESKFAGQSRVLYSKCILEQTMMLENLSAKMRPSEDTIVSLLADGENICAEYICFPKVSQWGEALSDSDVAYVRAGAEIFAIELEDATGHFALEYKAKNIQTEYAGLYPTIYNIDETDTALWKILNKLTPAGVSEVIEDEDGIYIYMVGNPLSNDSLMDVVCENYGTDLAKLAIEKKEKTLKTTNTDEINYLSVEKFAETRI